MDQNFGELQFNQNHRGQMQASEVARGQKIVIGAVLLNILAMGVLLAAPEYDINPQVGGMLLIGMWCARLLAFVMGIYGVVKIGSGLEWSGVSKFFIVILLLIPFINILALLVINGKATAFLKQAGYKVGLAGAYKPAA